jgi:hypothetical protein
LSLKPRISPGRLATLLQRAATLCSTTAQQDLRTQEFTIQSNQALINQSESKIAQITADYRRQLQTDRVDIAAQYEKAAQELAKNEHRVGLLELRATQSGVVKDLATHTIGTVASPGTILMTLVPEGDDMLAEIWVSNEDVGFVRPGQDVKLKMVAFQFQKYGMVEGKVRQVSADATEAPSPNTRSDALTGRDRPMGPLSFNRDLPFHMVNLYFVSAVVGGHLQKLLGPGPTVPDAPLAESDNELAEVLRRLSLMSRTFFPDEVRMPVAAVQYRGNSGGQGFSVLLELPARRIKARALPANAQARISWSGDGVSTTYKVPYWRPPGK